MLSNQSRKGEHLEQTAKEKRDKPMTPAQQREYMRVFVKNQSTTIYSTGWSMKYVKSLTDEQLIAEFEKIRMAVADLKSHELRRTLKRAGEALAPDTSKKQKSTKAPIPSVPDVPQLPVVSSPTSSGTRRKSLGRSRITKPKSILTELDLDVDDETFIKVVSDEDSEDEAPILWSAFAGWEVISTPLGEINALYMMDQSTKHFTTLREILHMGDLQVLIDSQEGGKGSFVWNHQQHWQIRSWRLYPLSNVHVLETVSGEVLYMFADVSYPLSVKLMERMLKHKLEIAKDVVGNDMTTAEQLIRFIKNQLVCQVSLDWNLGFLCNSLVGTLATIKSLKKPCIAGFMKPINSTPPPTPPLHHHSPPPTSSSMIVTPSTPKPTTTKPLYHRMPPLL
ncbi:hypothetical protein Tco_1243449 [Tanacetum coccineum]